MIKIAILGFGTIGQGVFSFVSDNADVLKKSLGDALEVKYVLDRKDFIGHPVEKNIVHDASQIASDPEVCLVVEALGGVDSAYAFVNMMIDAGKHVVTSNKELIAQKGVGLLQKAAQKNVNLMFEASVGGGIPIIHPLIHCITTNNRICEVTGILNGTTNYILTKMYEDGDTFADVLAQAQQLGYAESNPEADVEGFDACRKIAILSSIAYGKNMDYENIPTEGIKKVTREDFAYARKLGWKLKLLGTSTSSENGVYARVAPFYVQPQDPLFGVDGVFNAIIVHGDKVGDLMFYGRGAGAEPTASAVMADAITAIKNNGRVLYGGWDATPQELDTTAFCKSRFIIRVKGPQNERQPAVETFFGPVTVIDAGVRGELGYLTDPIEETASYNASYSIKGFMNKIRVRVAE